MISTPENPLSSPEEEISWLEQELRERKKKLGSSAGEKERFNATKEILKEAGESPDEVISENYRLKPEEVEKHTHALADESHHKQIDELLSIAGEHGLLNALKVVRKLNNPHLTDDFHDRLIAEGYLGK
ncbi:MAG: hypothetical protein COU46_01070 [Candidatus Niyogibacteria bacterium CG10_big_fil_rev_8_21_14_0_10_42_19]|uniref:Uncharacterized protein n=1 Tax=Candidatus Niyogibacteria bacterium CG10_big_fil_rev_8_21_14_0_10_42_19 TaxID=1974725 RepID=A0A2H0TG52_9BACT|nr:MAG: hypothetical protein COU46_01070 [Candidatus Niyogibacteria bacterium CG10_big_fil_rev_8_21_14_0_10_42_19]